MQQLPRASCVVIKRDGLYLGISRRKLPLRWGFPGGKVDGDEAGVYAAIRETFEEVGLKIDPNDLRFLHASNCPGEVTYYVATYLYTKEGPPIAELKAEDGLFLQYMSMADLIDLHQTPFASYNVRVFERLNDDTHIEGTFRHLI